MSSTRSSAGSRHVRAEARRQHCTGPRAHLPFSCFDLTAGRLYLPGMFRFAIGFVAGLMLAILTPAAVTAAPDDEADDIPHITLPSLPLEKLFDELAVSPDVTHSARFEAEILKRLHSSGSATTDLLLSWAVESMNKERYTNALDILDQVILLDPDFVGAGTSGRPCIS